MTLLSVVEYLGLVVFASLAAISARQWLRGRNPTGAWLAATFVLLAAIGVGIRLLDQAGHDRPALARVVLVELVLLPFCLFRFATSFSVTVVRWDVPARFITFALVVATAVLPNMPVGTGPGPWWWKAYRILLLLDWTVLSITSVARLCLAGRGQPAIAKSRMRTLAAAAILVNAAIVVGLGAGAHRSAARVRTTREVALLAGLVFMAGYAPPRALRDHWRRGELDAVRSAEAALMVATTADAVVAIALPNAVSLLGARAAMVVGANGRLVAHHLLSAHEAAIIAARLPLPTNETTPPLLESGLAGVAFRGGWLAIQMTPTTPFFGRDGLANLQTLGHLAGLAAERAELFERDRSARQALAEREAQLAEAQRTAQLGSYTWDPQTSETTWSDEMHRVFGFEPGEVTDHARAFASRIHPDDRQAVLETWQQVQTSPRPLTIEYRLVMSDGQIRWIQGRVRPISRPGKGPLVMGTVQDISERKLAEESMAFQARHDALTSLPNRTMFMDRLGAAIERRWLEPSGLAVLFLDLDRFKWLNDSLGHAAGDQLLVEVARRLQVSMRPGDTVARFGGDEFVVLCERLGSEAHAGAVAARLAAVLNEPVEILGEDTVVTGSIGIAYSPEPKAGETPDTLVRDADAAMYQAKDRGRDRLELFDESTGQAATARHELANALRRAIDREELVVHYQPELNITTGEVVGVEALVRWDHPQRGLLPPGEFIPLAEESGLIVPLGMWVLRTACHQVAKWNRETNQALSLSVNLATRQVMAPGLADEVHGALQSSGLDPSRLCLEITESVLLDDAENSARALHRLKSLGVIIGVDDFGTGFSSLTYLKRFPVDILKIDRSFVDGLGRHREDRAIVASVVDLANAFGLTTIAEGVETAEQLAELRAIGCEQGQGYLWCRPLGADEVRAWIISAARPAPLSSRRLQVVPDGETAAPVRRRVLIVEDDRVYRHLLRMVFDDDDTYEVVGEAEDGRDGVALARHYAPDLVLLDLAMPGMGGLEALPLIHAVAPHAKVIVLSALDRCDVADMVQRHGAAGYLAKDIDPTAIIDLVNPLVAAAI